LEKEIELVNLHGYGGLSKLQPLLEFAKKDGLKAYVIVDPHQGTKELMNRLVRDDLLGVNSFKIWKSEFEEDNFPEEEILAAVNEILADRMMPVSRNEVESLSRSDKPFMSRLREVFHMKYHTNLGDLVSKPYLAEKLLQKRIMEIRKEVGESKYKPKIELERVLSEVWKMIFHPPIV
jgi:hypothetical protein